MTYAEIMAIAVQAQADGFPSCRVTSFRRGMSPPCHGRVNIGRGGPNADLESWTAHNDHFHAVVLIDIDDLVRWAARPRTPSKSVPRVLKVEPSIAVTRLPF